MSDMAEQSLIIGNNSVHTDAMVNKVRKDIEFINTKCNWSFLNLGAVQSL